MREKQDVLAKWMTLEVGKPFVEAKGEVGGAADIFEQQVTPAPTPPPENTLPAGTPPLPPGGLPEGWTMDQWAHYGDEYRKQQGLD